MNTHLQVHLEEKMMAEWVAERIDREVEVEFLKPKVAEVFLKMESRTLDRLIKKARQVGREEFEPGGTPKPEEPTATFIQKVLASMVFLLFVSGLFWGIDSAGGWIYHLIVSQFGH